MKNILKLVLVFIIFTTIVSSYLLLENKDQKAVQFEPVSQSFCGTMSETVNDPNTQEGKRIFNSNCAACHKLDAFATGPALRDISKKYRENKLQLYNYLQGKRDVLLLRKSDKSNMGLCPIFPDLTKQNVASLEAYTH
ncbi:c-type cytochrome [Flavobacterium sp.]